MAETEAAHDSRSDPTFLEDKLPTSHSYKDPLHRQEVSVAIVLIAGDPLEAYIVEGRCRGGELFPICARRPRSAPHG